MLRSKRRKLRTEGDEWREKRGELEVKSVEEKKRWVGGKIGEPEKKRDRHYAEKKVNWLKEKGGE